MTVVSLDLDLIVNIEAGVFPGEEPVDRFPADLLFPEQHLKDLMAEEVLLPLDISLVERFLNLPARQPLYRENRSRKDFLTNLKVPSHRIKEPLNRSWNATSKLKDVPFGRIDELAAMRYSKKEWSGKL